MFYQGQHEDPNRIKKRKIRLMVCLFCAVFLLGGTGFALCKTLVVPAMTTQRMVQTEEAPEHTAWQAEATPEQTDFQAQPTAGASAEPTAEASLEPATTETPAATRAPALSIMMVGDDLLHGPVSNSGLRARGKYNYDNLFVNIKKDIKQADLSMINQEVILGGEALRITGYPTFNGRYEVGDAIAKAGFNMVLHATNHAIDRGSTGINNCLKFWQKKHPEIKVTGLYNSQKKQDKITYYKKNGITVAVLNYTYGTNGIPLPQNMPFAVNLLSKKKVSRDVKMAKKNADFIMVCPHWGTEYNLASDAMQAQWTQYFLKLGVNLVIGTHPHVVEPVKWVKDKAGHKMLVYYSLGNFINASSLRGSKVCHQYFGGMAKVKLKRGGNGKVEIDTAQFVPLITHWPANGRLTTYKVKNYKKSMVSQNRLKRQDPLFSYEYMRQFFTKEINKKFLTW